MFPLWEQNYHPQRSNKIVQNYAFVFPIKKFPVIENRPARGDFLILIYEKRRGLLSASLKFSDYQS